MWTSSHPPRADNERSTTGDDTSNNPAPVSASVAPTRVDSLYKR